MSKILAVGMMFGLMALSGLAQTVREREATQQKRIVHGVRSGELTRREAVKLERKETKLHREIRRDRVDGRGLTPAERLKIEKKQDRLSREIAKQKHDGQAR